MRQIDKAKLFVVALFIAGTVVLLLTDNRVNRSALAFSSGPPAGFTGAPGEFTCAECHVPESAGTGHISINGPQTYVPGQTYQITVSHSNTDPTRKRWGFQLTALDDAGQKAGTLQAGTSGLVQILDNQGPGGARQYAEHTASGTFNGQQFGASWTFDWTAPQRDVGPITFYAAGNQANGDGNTSGDNIYFTFVQAQPSAPTSDFSLSITPASQTVLQGNSVSYNLTITPSGSFTGAVNLSVSGNPSGTTVSFNPTTVNLTDSSPKSSVMTVNVSSSAAIGTYPLTITATSGNLQHTTTATLIINSTSSADLSLIQTVSPNPGQVGTSLVYRLIVTNNGPATSTNVRLTDTLPSGVAFVSASPDRGTCTGSGPINCNLGSLAVNESVATTITVSPNTTGQQTNTATISGNEPEPNTTNNSSSLMTLIEPQALAPSLLDPNLSVRTLVNGLDSPISMAFIGASDLLVLEKATGKVQRISNGHLQTTVLDLAVNSASERGLLGIALHPDFSTNGFVYLFWTESSTGQDTSNTAEVPLLGNRVDRYLWNGSVLSFDRNLIRLRAYQEDAGQPLRANHNGGVLRFGPDNKLYIIMGDNGRRGLLQNITSGGPVPDDQYGGPEPDNAHLTGVILRLNDDGTTPTDNPFFNANTGLAGEAAVNIRKVYAYGIRNSFGMAFDPINGYLWTQENGDDSFDEINRVEAGFNGGWIQMMGPSSRVSEYKAIEMSRPGGLQQNRWPPSMIADTPQQALSRLYALPNSHYTEPEFSWKYALAPSPIGFVRGQSLGSQYEGSLFVGASRTTLEGGYLFRFGLTDDRKHLAPTDFRLSDRVADNADKFDLGESESLLVGKNFGVTTDIQTGPNGNLYIVSLSNGAIYEIYATPPTLFVAQLNGSQEVPPTSSSATGTATLLLSPDEKSAKVSLSFSNLSSAQTDAHIHGPAPAGTNAAVLFPLPSGSFSDYQINLTPAEVQSLKDGLFYINVHSANFPAGEIRGQFGPGATASSFQFSAANYSVYENSGVAVVTVTRFGSTSSAASVNYATSDTAGLTSCSNTNGIASSRCDYSSTFGTLGFAPGETSKIFTISIVNDGFAEGSERATLTLNNPTGGSILGGQSTATLIINDNETTTAGFNPIDSTPFFVRQHYIDFLGREPDPAGFQGWQNILNNCPPNDTRCDRIEVSGAFFRSAEFQERGYFVYRFYSAALGRLPHYQEFIPDMAKVSGFLTPEEQEANKVAFINEFMGRQEFRDRYDSLTAPAAYVDELLRVAGVTLPQRDALVQDLAAGRKTRAEVLRVIVESAEVYFKFYNEAFVVMQYFGYLRRDPDALYLNWIQTLNRTGDYRLMINGFMNSVEYRQRFGP